ncbi:MAG: cellulase family glycosylhydrolase [Nitrososphaerota archaeon]|nr:cellulase family glycosylhydrolase [Nitrososphaerota archaeon]
MLLGVTFCCPNALAQKSPRSSSAAFKARPLSTPPETGVAVVDGRLIGINTRKPFMARGLISEALSYPTQYAATLCGSHFAASAAAANLREAQAAITAAPLPGLGYNASFQAMAEDWHANAVRFNLSQGALQYEYAHGLSAYTDMVRKVIEQARRAGLIVIIDMQAELYSCTPYEQGALQKLPDIETEHAWAQLLDARLTRDKGIMIEVFNEPSTTKACKVGTYRHPDWATWETGCGNEPDQGMLTVGQWLRKQAPNNVLLFNGDGVSFGFVGFTVPKGMPSNSAYSVHPFHYLFRGNLTDNIEAWNNQFGNFERSGHAVIVTAWNEGFECPTDPNQIITNDFIQRYLTSHSIGMVAYGWDAPVHAAGYLVNSYSYPGNTANYQVVDPNTQGCAHDGGKLLQKEFQTQAAQQ